jgi:hypothetical protein
MPGGSDIFNTKASTDSSVNIESTSVPSLDNGQSQYSGHALVSRTLAKPHNLLLDVTLPLIAAIVLPLALKYALESRVFRRMFRFSPSSKQKVEMSGDTDFDFD